jgi:hypothetical protein
VNGFICTILAYVLTDPLANNFVNNFANSKLLAMAIGLTDVTEFGDLMRYCLCLISVRCFPKKSDQMRVAELPKWIRNMPACPRHPRFPELESSNKILKKLLLMILRTRDSLSRDVALFLPAASRDAAQARMSD